jgi:hypothetical protein
MPDTPGKRQRRDVKAKRRQAKDEKRNARRARRQDPTLRTSWEQAMEQGMVPGDQQDDVPSKEDVTDSPVDLEQEQTRTTP